MKKSSIQIGNYEIPVYTQNTVIVGTGAAGYNAADRLHQYGQTDIAMVTEGILAGTSRNTGSDKQTYYKLTLSGSEPDSVGEMAKTLFDGQCVDGDLALCEAALSAGSFLRLVELGVPFPRNRHGEYIGYKTDHDPRRRATSVGPYTSKMMTEQLEKSVHAKGIQIFDRMQVIKILAAENQVAGLLCLNLDKQGTREQFTAFSCKNIIYATGGPAGIYHDSVFPHGHYGASGIAFEAGVKGKNLTEWQFGLSSIAPRWNVSGTFMQVLPKFISTDPSGGDARAFLEDFFTDRGAMLGNIFLKGYQWPFDVRKVTAGSSIIDILVYMETCKGRRVFLDFRENPGGRAIDFSTLPEEARRYLEDAGACFGSPIERLLHMNAPSVSFYKDKGVDLRTEPLEIALCAQHNNGGLDIDAWWQTNVEGFFAAGEVAASHGVYRPGGSALNAGQVGSTRAAMYIAAKRGGEANPDFEALAKSAISEAVELADTALGEQETAHALWETFAIRMSRSGGAIRNRERLNEALADVQHLLKSFKETVRISDPRDLWRVYRLWDTLLAQSMYLGAMQNYIEAGGKSRGSALYTDPEGEKSYPSLPDMFTFTEDDGSRGSLVQEASYSESACQYTWREVRPIPEDDDFFENVWRSFRETGNI